MCAAANITTHGLIGEAWEYGSALPRRTLKGGAVVLLGLAAVFAVLSGIGTSCVAWSAASYAPFASLAPYGWLFQLLVYANLAAGVVGVAIAFALMRQKRGSYAGSVAVLIVLIVTAVVQMYYSSSLRGVSFFATPPTSIRLYVTGAVLLYFLVLRAPFLTKATGMTPSPTAPSQKGVAGAFLVAAGVAVVTAPVWASPGHIVGGYNYVNDLLLPLAISGGFIILGGIGMLTRQTPAHAGHLPRFWRKGWILIRFSRLWASTRSLFETKRT